MDNDEAVDPESMRFVTVYCVTVQHDGDSCGRNRRAPENVMFFSEQRAHSYKATYPWYIHGITRRLAVKLGDVYHPLGEPFVRIHDKVAATHVHANMTSSQT
jgi:hypothetical protein